ncbi:MAG: hypothetical protein SGILL_003349, partial [Bacillariaceae sp.]
GKIDFGNAVAAMVAVSGYMFEHWNSRKSQQRDAQIERVNDQSHKLLVPVTMQFHSIFLGSILHFVDKHLDDAAVTEGSDAKYNDEIDKQFLESGFFAQPTNLKDPRSIRMLMLECTMTERPSEHKEQVSSAHGMVRAVNLPRELPIAIHKAIGKVMPTSTGKKAKDVSPLWRDYEAFVRFELAPGVQRIAEIIDEYGDLMEPVPADRLYEIFGREDNGYGQTIVSKIEKQLVGFLEEKFRTQYVSFGRLDGFPGAGSPRGVNECNINDDRSIYHSGGTNLDAVVSWIEAQFPDGLEALVIASGGKLGGCDDTANTSTIATALLASKLSSYAKDSQSSDALVISEGSGLFDSNLPSPDDLATRWNSIDIPHGGSLLEGVEDWIQSSPESVKVAWLASPGGRAGDDEEALVGSLQMSKGPSFHILQAPPSRSNVACPVYAFPESSDSYVFGTFLRSIVQRLSWNDAPETAAEKSRAVAYSDGRNRLSFLTIFILVLAVLVLVWITYYVLKRKKSALLSPTDVWFLALTRYPLTFMVVSVAIPLSLAIAVYAKSGYQVPMNLDFDSYLEINTPLENVRRAYDDARALQRESLNVEIENCELIMSDDFQLPSAGRRYLFEDKSFTIEINHDMDLDNFDTHERELSLANMLYSSGGEAISVMYQNRNGGNVFEPEVLREIYEFEQSLYAFPGFGDYCFGFGRGRCVPIDSLVTHFFVNGEIVSDIEGIVRSFLGNQPALWKLDQNFGPDNLNSEVIRSFIFLNNVGGDQRAAHPFLESLYRDYFWKADQSNAYSHMIHTWDNAYLRDVEANDALRHDTLWSIGSLCFIALMVLLKVRSLFVVFFSMLGLVLAFAASYYWASIHFAIESPTLLWVAGLYVMLGIGADDIFLMVDSFEHTKIDFDANETSRCECATEDDKEAKLDVLRDRMQQAYRKAGGMMLVSSVTTAICFFSNAFGVLVVIQEFGIFMG